MKDINQPETISELDPFLKKRFSKPMGLIIPFRKFSSMNYFYSCNCFEGRHLITDSKIIYNYNNDESIMIKCKNF